MDDWGGPGVEEVEALEDLPAPAAEHFDFHHLEPLQISATGTLHKHEGDINVSDEVLKVQCVKIWLELQF